MPCELHVVDAFTRSAFRGNPAAVCVLENLAFPSGCNRWQQNSNIRKRRFFLPFLVVGTCGGLHRNRKSAPTPCDPCLCLRSLEDRESSSRHSCTFETLSGKLSATQEEGWIDLDFPATPGTLRLLSGRTKRWEPPRFLSAGISSIYW